MSTQPKDGGPAFPGIEGESGYGNAVKNETTHGIAFVSHNQGMTLRDWFAGQALAGILSLPDNRSCPLHEDVEAWQTRLFQSDAQFAWRSADAMIATRNKATP